MSDLSESVRQFTSRLADLVMGAASQCPHHQADGAQSLGPRPRTHIYRMDGLPRPLCSDSASNSASKRNEVISDFKLNDGLKKPSWVPAD
jgi:hypothetical protein